MSHANDRFPSIGAVTVLLVAIAMLAAAHPVLAGDAGDRQLSEEQGARMEERMDEIRTRLALSEEQKAQLEPVLKRNFEQRAEVLQRHGVTEDRTGRLGLREARALKRDLEAVRKQTDAEVEQILDSRQMDEFRKIQDEAREELRERVRSRRS